MNEQPYEYWRTKFTARGYAVFDCARRPLMGLKEIEPWYRFNTFLFANEHGQSRLSIARAGTSLRLQGRWRFLHRGSGECIAMYVRACCLHSRRGWRGPRTDWRTLRHRKASGSEGTVARVCDFRFLSRGRGPAIGCVLGVMRHRDTFRPAMGSSILTGQSAQSPGCGPLFARPSRAWT